MSSGTNKQRITQNNTIISNNNDDIDTLKSSINNLIDTSTTTAIASDIAYGKTAVCQGALITGTSNAVDTSDANAVALNIRNSKTAYVNGQKITGTLPVKTYDSASTIQQTFITADDRYTVNKNSTDYVVLSYLVAAQSEPDSWMFEGNRKMKLGIPYSLLASTLGVYANKIKQGKSILGVSGSVVEVNNESSREVTPTTSKQTIKPASGKTGLSQVVVKAVTSDIDANIQPENIVAGVTILEVEGAYQAPNVPAFQSYFDYDAQWDVEPINDIATVLANLQEEYPTLISQNNNSLQYFYQNRVRQYYQQYAPGHTDLKMFPSMYDTDNVNDFSEMFVGADVVEIGWIEMYDAVDWHYMFLNCNYLSNNALHQIATIITNIDTTNAMSYQLTLSYLGLNTPQINYITTQLEEEWEYLEGEGWTAN